MEVTSEAVKEMWSELVRSKTDSSLPQALYDVQIDALRAILNRKHLFFIINTGSKTKQLMSSYKNVSTATVFVGGGKTLVELTATSLPLLGNKK